MVIKDLQRQLMEVGRVRTGYSVDTGKKDRSGNPIFRPVKSATFLVSTHLREYADEVARIYGGTVEEWTPQRSDVKQWLVRTKTNTLSVVVPPVQTLTQWYEFWPGAECTRRCDGVTETISNRPCLCGPGRKEGPTMCKATSRLNVCLYDPADDRMLAHGVWRVESHGYNNAIKLPTVTDDMQASGVAQRATLRLVEHSKVKGGKKMVWYELLLQPAHTTAAQLTGTPGRLAIGSAAPAAIDAGPEVVDVEEAPDPVVSLLELVRTAASREELRELWEGEPSHLLTDQVRAAMMKRSAELAPPEPAPAPAVPPPVVAEAGDWPACVVAAGKAGWSTSRTIAVFREVADGRGPDAAQPEDFARFLAKVAEWARP
jgi:hypothetical protein